MKGTQWRGFVFKYIAHPDSPLHRSRVAAFEDTLFVLRKVNDVVANIARQATKEDDRTQSRAEELVRGVACTTRELEDYLHFRHISLHCLNTSHSEGI